jgi:hypothetical protein
MLPPEILLLLLVRVYFARCQRGLIAVRRVCKLFNYLSRDRRNFKNSRGKDACNYKQEPSYIDEYGIRHYYYCCENKATDYFMHPTFPCYVYEVDTGLPMHALDVMFSKIRLYIIPDNPNRTCREEFLQGRKHLFKYKLDPHDFSLNGIVNLYKELQEHKRNDFEEQLKIIAKYAKERPWYRRDFTHIGGKFPSDIRSPVVVKIE